MGKLSKLICFLLTFGCITDGIFSGFYAQLKGRGELYMNDRLVIPFDVIFNGKPRPELKIINGEEQIILKCVQKKSDSLVFTFPFSSGKIVFHRKTHHGYWLNLNKADPSRFPLVLYFSNQLEINYCHRFDQSYNDSTDGFLGTFEVAFNDPKESSSAIGMFYQQGPRIVGTFRTQTGDFRFLSGGIFGEKLKLSCFDGYHAYLFEAHKDSSGRLQGEFFSGSRYHANWTGIKKENADLLPMNSINSSKVPYDHLNINVKTLKGKEQVLDSSNFMGRPTVIQILGSWCPNCLDESLYFTALSTSELFRSIRFVGVAFENGKTDKEKINRIQAFSNRTSLKYPLYLGGGASSSDAEKVFHQLNGVYSFPTTLFLDKKGRIVEVHSGFDGPATGAYFELLKNHTEALLLKLINE